MATLANSAIRRWTTASSTDIRISPWFAVICSRLMVMGAGVAGALNGTRVAGWALFDPNRISADLGSVGNVLAATAVRWDSIHYLQIAEHGYRTTGNTVFFPAYPLLMHVIALVVGSEVMAGVAISAVAFTVALVLLHRLTSEELGPRAADATVTLLAFAPLSFFFTAIYTESLFLALSVGTFYLARRRRFALASLTASVAALTRVPGVLLVLPVGLMYLRAQGNELHRRSERALTWVRMSVALLPALALCGLCTYFHARGYGWLAPITNQTSSTHGHSMSGPLITLGQALLDACAGIATMVAGSRPSQPSLGGPFTIGFQNIVCLLVLGICVSALTAAWRRLPKVYAIYAALSMVVCIWSPVAQVPLRSIDRYTLVIFPLWMAAGAKLSERRWTAVVVALEAALLCFYAYELSCWVFVA